jgi:hypothetical protein
MTKKRTLQLLWITVVLVFGVVLVACLGRHQPMARIPLPDGTELRLEYATYGTEHRIPGVGKVHAWLSKIARERLGWKDAPQHEAEYKHATSDPMLVLWFSRYSPQSRTYLQEISEDVTIYTVDDANAYSLSRHNQNPGSPLPNMAVEVPLYDRRKDTTMVRVVWEPDMRDGTLILGVPAAPKIADIVVRNPAAKIPFPVWTPERLPQTRRVGDVDAVLRSVKLTEDERGRISAEPEYEFLHRGQVVDDAFDARTVMTDATGNEVYENEGRLLPLSEQAWRLRLQLRRTVTYPFRAEEGQTIGPVAMPGEGQHAVFKLTDHGPKRAFRFAVLLGPGCYTWRDGAVMEAGPPLKAYAEVTKFAGWVVGPDTLKVNTLAPVLLLISANDPANLPVWDRLEMMGRVRDPDAAKANVVLLKESNGTRPLSEVLTYGRWSPWDEVDNSLVAFKSDALRIARIFTLSGLDLDLQPTDGPEIHVPTGASISIQIVPVMEESVDFLVAPPKPNALPKTESKRVPAG